MVISAPSGGGKTTLVNELLTRFQQARRSISTTTRPARNTEINKQDYNFISNADFDRLMKDDAFAEWALVHGHRYGTLKATVNDAVGSGQLLFLVIDVQGAKSIKKAFPQALTVFVMPPDFDVLETRLRKRGTESDAEIRKRLESARNEIAQAEAFDYRVLNDRLDRAALEIESIIRKQLKANATP